MIQVCDDCKKQFEAAESTLKQCFKDYGKILCKDCKHNIYILKNYGTYENYMKFLKERREAGMLRKYGVKNPSQCKLFREKMNKSIQEAQDRRMETLKKNNLKKYGVEYTFQREDCKQHIKETLIERYGVEHALQSEDFRKKQSQTMMERYGVDNSMHNKDIHDKVLKSLISKTCEEWSKIASKRRKRYEYDNVMFDSMWEIKVYKYCKEHSIPIERGPTVLLEDGHKFEIDFVIKDRLCEVKSSFVETLNSKRSELKKKYILGHNGIFISDDKIKDLSFLSRI